MYLPLPPSRNFLLFLPRGLAAAPVAAAALVQPGEKHILCARSSGPRRRRHKERTRIEIETRWRNEIERNGGNKFTLLVNPFAVIWRQQSRRKSAVTNDGWEASESVVWSESEFSIAIDDQEDNVPREIDLWRLLLGGFVIDTMIERVRLFFNGRMCARLSQ